MKLDDLNPQVAADTVKPLTSWKRYDAERQAMMKGALEKVLAKPNLSKNVYELVSKSLSEPDERKSKILENKAKTQKQAKTDAFLKKTPVKTYVSGAKKTKAPAHFAMLQNVGAKTPVVNTLAMSAQKQRDR